MNLIPNSEIFKVEGDTVRYLQLRKALTETDAFVRTVLKTPGGFHQSNSAGGLRSVDSFEEACELGQRAAIRLRELAANAVSGR